MEAGPASLGMGAASFSIVLSVVCAVIPLTVPAAAAGIDGAGRRVPGRDFPRVRSAYFARRGFRY
jgi:hypothetical protein